MTPCELWLVRHGESAGNAKGILQGQFDLPCSERGLAQAHLLAARLAAIHAHTPFAALVSSDLRRCRQTAEPVATALQRPLRLEPGLREVHAGPWSGLSDAEIAQFFPAAWARWQDRDGEDRRSGGESYADAGRRAMTVINTLAAEQAGERVLVFTHGGILLAWLCLALDLPVRHLWHLICQNTSITRVQWQPGCTPTLLCMNDHAHLGVVG